jgi:hypothetical protein
MDYLDIRREFGSALNLIGGIRREVLSRSENHIRAEVERVVPQLLSSGGYIPLLDGRVREEIPYSNYHYYRTLLAEIVSKK